MTTPEANSITKWLKTNLIVLIVQTSVIVWWASGIDTRVERNERDITKLMNWQERVTLRTPGPGAILTEVPSRPSP